MFVRSHQGEELMHSLCIPHRCRMKYQLLACLFFLAVSSSVFAQPSDVVTHRTTNAIYIRWKPVRSSETIGYNLYRQSGDAATWERITREPLARVRNVSQLRAFLSADAAFFLGMFKLPQDAQELDDTHFNRVAEDQKNAFFLNLLSATNPRVALALGEMFIDSTVMTGSRVRYRVMHVTRTGERAIGETPPLIAGTPDVIPAIVGLEAIASNETVTLRWRKNTEAMRSGMLVTWNVYRSDNILGPYERINANAILPLKIIVDGGKAAEDVETYADLYLQNGKTFYYYLRPVNAFGLEGPETPTVTATPGDTTTLQAPSNLQARIFGTGILLEWEMDDLRNVGGYEIFAAAGREPFALRYSSELLGTPSEMNYTDLKVAEGQAHHYIVRAIDANGKPGAFSDTVSLMLPDVTPPQSPKNVRAKSERNRIVLTWDANKESDLRGYYVERSGGEGYRDYIVLNNTPTKATSFADTLRPGTSAEFSYVVFATDRFDNRSAASEPVRTRLLDQTAPRPPKIVTLRESEKNVTVEWTPSPEPDVKAYLLFRSVKDSTKFQQIAATDSTKKTDPLPGDGVYWYAVAARDESGNTSIRSQAMTLSTQTVRKPSQPKNLRAFERSGRVVLTWDVATKEVRGWMIARKLPDGKQRDLAQVKEPKTEFIDGYSDSEKEQTYTVRAFDSRWRYSEDVEVRYIPQKKKEQ